MPSSSRLNNIATLTGVNVARSSRATCRRKSHSRCSERMIFAFTVTFCVNNGRLADQLRHIAEHMIEGAFSDSWPSLRRRCPAMRGAPYSFLNNFIAREAIPIAAYHLCEIIGDGRCERGVISARSHGRIIAIVKHLSV
jgi:hypothetical protein